MIVNRILKAVNKQLDDEGLSVDDILDYLDGAVSEINEKCYAKYPTFSGMSANPDPSGIEIATMDYTAIPEMWIRMIIVPYVCTSYKIQDDEDPTFFISQYKQNLNMFLHTYQIPEEYQDTDRLQMLFGGVDIDVSRNFSGGGW